MFDLHQGAIGGEIRGAGASVLTIVTEQAQVFVDLRRGKLWRALKRQTRLNLRLTRLLLQRKMP